MILNEQIMSQLDQNFEELVRFTKIVAEEPELIQKIDQYMSEPNEANNAKISLFLSQLGVKNKIQSYGIIGIYLDVQKADEIYDFSTVGFSNKVKEHICSEIKELDLERKSTHNRRERPVHGHRGRSRGPFYYRITTFGEGPWDARDPHKTTFMTLK